MKIRFLLIFVGLATNFALPAFAQQKEPSLSEQDRAQIVAGREATTRGSSALKRLNEVMGLASTAIGPASMSEMSGFGSAAATPIKVPKRATTRLELQSFLRFKC